VLNATHRILDCTIFPIKDPDGRVTNAVFQQKDVTEQKRAEIKLLESERKYRALADNSRDAIARFDKNFRLLYISPAVVRLSGYEAEEFESKDVFSIVHPEDLPELKEKIRENIENRVENSTSAFRIIKKSGQEVWIESVSTYCYDGEGRFTGMIVNERDITDRKMVEEELKKALKEKDFLMREINHRIKNNLMTITSLLRLKCQSLETEVDLSDLEHQIDAIRIIHEKLYQDENVTDIRFPEYVQQLLETVFSSFSGGEVVIENRITDCRFSAKIVAPLGLIVNELATNAIKHAFPGFYGETGKGGNGGRSAGSRFDSAAAGGGRKAGGGAAEGGSGAEETPRFRVELTRDSERKEYVLRISNNGPPLPEDVDITSPKTLGLLLVSELSVQLGGELEIIRTPHPEFILTFPDPDQ
jgi:PAS domain S-box-containing protein